MLGWRKEKGGAEKGNVLCVLNELKSIENE
jgi:hypothetical protein